MRCYVLFFMKYKLVIAYDGTSFGGWQIQSNSISIQALIQEALSTILQEPLFITGSGRTDAGVHAMGQVAHFTTDKPFECARLQYSLNGILPPTIRILTICPVPDHFHARYSASSKEYHYHLHLKPALNPFKRLYSHPVYTPLDLNLMAEGAKYLIGTHDFTSFANEAHAGTAARDAIRTLTRLTLAAEEDGIRLEFEGDGFLYKMVRNLTGTLLDVGAGKILPTQIEEIFAAKDRRKASSAAPALGLFLMKVSYPDL